MAKPQFDYPVGSSSGFATAENMAYGLAGKAGYMITHGIKFVQIDVQNIVEFAEPDFIRRMKRIIEELDLRWGMHAEITENTAFDSAFDKIWELSHIRLNEYLDYFKEYLSGNDNPKKVWLKKKPEYVDFHISVNAGISIRTVPSPVAYEVTVTPWGERNWINFFRHGPDSDRNIRGLARTVPPDLLRWFKSNLLHILYERVAPVLDPIAQAFQWWIERRIEQGETITQPQANELREKIVRQWANNTKLHTQQHNYYDPQTEMVIDNDINQFLDFLYGDWERLSAQKIGWGAIGLGEPYVYALIAKYVEYAEPEIWRLFAGNRSMPQLLREINADYLITYDGIVNLHPRITAMVAARYILGHFETPVMKIPFTNYRDRLSRRALAYDSSYHELSPIDKLKKLGIDISFENPALVEQLNPGAQRIARLSDMVAFSKAGEVLFGSNSKLKLLFDPSWLLVNGLNPEREIAILEDGDGKYFIAVQVHFPEISFRQTGHGTIDLGSDMQVHLYKWLLELQKKGMHKAPIVFERGVGRFPLEVVKETIFVIRNVVDELNKQTPADKLPKEFFGFGKGGAYSEDRQLVTIKEHLRDPLKGFIMIPEEDWSFLSSRAREMQKLEEWRKGKLR